MMGHKLIPMLASTLMLMASSCSPQPAPLQHPAPLPPANGDRCLPPGPCNYPSGGTGGFFR